MLKMHLLLLLPRPCMLPESGSMVSPEESPCGERGLHAQLFRPPGIQAAGQRLTPVHAEVAVIPHKSTCATSCIGSWVRFT